MASTKAAVRNVVVTVDDEHLAHIAQVAKQLREKGMTVTSLMASLGLISGSVSAGATDLRRVPGVVSVEDEPHFQLAPPEAEVQ